ncbi:unnamed protein product [Orchesella dallaii]|uniref:Pickpocket protein 28 n=1 Tax=Orchesella dallaii TaxID=48710 RepID=A0ABP1QE71_9HEXA
MNSKLPPQVSDIFLNKNSPQYSTSWASKIEVKKSTKLPGWTPVRLSGKFRFKKKSSKAYDQDKSNNNEKSHSEGKKVSKKNLLPGCTYQFHEYCQHTSLHGFRYVTEERRALSERIFWICWCLFGISSAGYMMSKIWQRWQINPVLTSIATTNHPVSAINFPAVTICTVNKAVSEKLIIQGCRENKTFTEMRRIISTLVDPESRNNENDQEGKKESDTKKALRILRLVAPKCSDFILTCELNSKPRECKELFKLVLTDTGYCCTFNAMDTKSKTVSGDNYTDTEIDQQEREYDVLQKIVWNFTDEYQKKHPKDDGNSTSLPSDLKTCNRTYRDELLQEGADDGKVNGDLCKMLQKCREDPGSCGLSNQNESTEAPPTLGSSSTTSTPGKNGSHLFRAAGAGRRRGLTIITDTLRCAAVPTDSFKGLRVSHI